MFISVFVEESSWNLKKMFFPTDVSEFYSLISDILNLKDRKSKTVVAKHQTTRMEKVYLHSFFFLH
jgi:hypothetical protein